MPDSIFFQRRSGRAYQDRPIAQDVLDRVFERVRWSPSCSNNQPWRFVVARGGNRRERFNAALADGNRWADRAPVLIAVCGRQRDDFTRKDDPVEYYQFDCGLAVMSLLLAAVDEGLMGHPMAGYKAVDVKKALDIPEDFSVVCVISLGYEGSSADLDETTRAKDLAPRTRKGMNEIISYDRFGFA